NAEFADQASDHDPSVVRLTLDDPPSANAGGPYSVAEGSSITLSASGTDPEGDPLTYAWDLDGNGTFETPGQSVTFSAPDGPATPTVKVRVIDDGGLSDVAEAIVLVPAHPPPLPAGAFNVVNRGQVVPVKITVGCNGFLSGLHPAISIRSGDYDPSVDPGDPSYTVPVSVSGADTSGVMRESDGKYMYNLAV